VTTDLPLEVDKPISFGVHDFCMACEKCARHCPAQAIPYGPPARNTLSVSNNPGYEKWYIDAEKCFIFWGSNRKKWDSCNGRCIVVCPWNKPSGWQHTMAKWAAINMGKGVKRLLVRLDDMRGHGKRPV